MKVPYVIALIVGVINMNAAHANKLDLSRKNLQPIPAELYEESPLEELWLDDNQIMQLPKKFSNYRLLRDSAILTIKQL